MNKIYVPECQEHATYDLLRAIYHNARSKDADFAESNYKWSLGVEVINDIANGIMFMNAPNEPMQLFGIPVGRDYPNPQKIELWRNVTND